MRAVDAMIKVCTVNSEGLQERGTAKFCLELVVGEDALRGFSNMSRY